MGFWDRALSWFVDPDPDGQQFDATWGTETRWFDLGNYEPTPVRIVEQVLDALPIPPSATTRWSISAPGRAGWSCSRADARSGRWSGNGTPGGPPHRRRAEPGRVHPSRRVPVPDSPDVWDAARHPLPDGKLVVWLFNPFGADVLQVLLRRLTDRDVVLVYVTPIPTSRWSSKPGFGSSRAAATATGPGRSWVGEAVGRQDTRSKIWRGT